MGTIDESKNNQNIPLILGKLSSLTITMFGLGYFLSLLVLMITGNFKLPPPVQIQIFAAIVDLVVAPLMVVLVCSVFFLIPDHKKVLALAGLAFTLMFALVVCINRITQLTVVYQSISSGNTDGLEWFLPYEPQSIMFAMEIMGFSFFLSIALLFVALSLKQGEQKAIKITLFVYSGLGLASFAGFLSNSLLINVGFIAWGLVLYIATWLMYRWFSGSFG
jgi:hypothetical protein